MQTTTKHHTTEPITPTYEDVLAACDQPSTLGDDKPVVRTLTSIGRVILKNRGYDWNTRAAGAYGGSEMEELSAQLRTGVLKRLLDEAADKGDIEKMRAEDAGGLYATSRRAWVYISTRQEERRQAFNQAHERDVMRGRFMKEAEQHVLGRYAATVRVEYWRLCDEAGIAPDEEAQS